MLITSQKWNFHEIAYIWTIHAPDVAKWHIEVSINTIENTNFIDKLTSSSKEYLISVLKIIISHRSSRIMKINRSASCESINYTGQRNDFFLSEHLGVVSWVFKVADYDYHISFDRLVLFQKILITLKNPKITVFTLNILLGRKQFVPFSTLILRVNRDIDSEEPSYCPQLFHQY